MARSMPKWVAGRRKSEGGGEYPLEIERSDWKDFLNDFSAEHEGWKSQISVFLPDQTPRIETHGLSFEGISVDLKPKAATTAVSVGNKQDAHLIHMVPRTTRITALNENELEIEAADRNRTVVRCREPRRPGSEFRRDKAA